MLTTVPHKYMYAQKDFLLFEIHILNICTEGTCYLQKYTIAFISYKWYLVLQYLVDALTFNNFFFFFMQLKDGLGSLQILICEINAENYYWVHYQFLLDKCRKNRLESRVVYWKCARISFVKTCKDCIQTVNS